MSYKWFRWLSHLFTGYFICRTLYLMLEGEWGLGVVYAIITIIDIVCDVVYLTDEND